MKRDVQSIVLVLIGSALLRISLGGEMYLRYVKAGLRPALIAAGAILLLLGLIGVVRDGILRKHEQPAGEEHHHEAHGPDAHDEHAAPGGSHGHDHSQGPRVAWLLCLPVIALFLIAPPALGSYTAERSDNVVAKPAAKTVDAGFPALPPGDPLDMTVGDFSVRAVWDTADTLKDRNVRLTGFVTPGPNGTWYVTRLVISCCAADATARKVEIHGMAAPPTDAWVQVTGTWLKSDGAPASESTVPALTATKIDRIPTPKEPYE